MALDTVHVVLRLRGGGRATQLKVKNVHSGEIRDIAVKGILSNNLDLAKV